MEKQCFKCGEVKPLGQFYKHPRMADGRVNKCKECNKLDVRENRARKVEHYRDYDKRRAMAAHRVEMRARYAQTQAGKAARDRSAKRWAEKHVIRRAASHMVNNAVRDGRLEKSSKCEQCGASNCRIHGHHDDYAFPLSVRWLCPRCHMAWHRENGAAANG